MEHEIVFACDIDKYVKESYFANYETKHWFDDIRDITKEKIQDELDVFIGGSPCQSFSVAGKRLGFEDTRGTLFFEYARCVKELQPKVFIYENVKGLLSHDGGRTWETIKNVFDDLGYTYHYQVLNSKDYGIPQNRQRIFVVGFRNDFNVDFKFPEKQELKLRVKDLLETSVAPKYNLSNVVVQGIKSRTDKEFSENSVYTNRYDEPLRENKFGISHTLRASLSSVPIIYESTLRKLTPRECLRLMGFSDDFKQVVSDSQMYKQTGNSIVVNVLEEIIKNIWKN